MRLPTVFLIALLVGCTSTKRFNYEYWASQSTPDIFQSNRTWAFVLLNSERKIHSNMIIEFTDEIASTCSDNENFRINILNQAPPVSPNNIAEPAYSVKGAAIIIDLSANFCDNGYELAGPISDLGISGVHYPVTMFGGEIQGTFYGVPVKVPNKAR